MRQLVYIFFIFSALPVSAQQLIIKDAATFKGIPDVLVMSQSHSEISNLKGAVELSGFTAGDSLIIQHPSYNTLMVFLESINTDRTVELLEKSIKLDEVVVSVSRWAESSAEFPNKVVGVTTNDISFSNPQTTADALMQTGEIYVQKSQLGGGSPMIRGFAANRILLTVDGIRLNNAIYRSGNLQNIISVDAHSLERTEVIFGPGSVQYGSDALGGVINMMTHEARLSSGEPIVSGSGMIRYSSANNERTAHFDMKYSGERFASSTSISFSHYGDQVMGSNGPIEYLRNEYVGVVDGADVILSNDNPEKQVSTGFAQFSFIQKLKFRLNDHLVSDFGFYYANTDNIPRYDRLIQTKNGILRYANWYYGPQKWTMARAELTYTKRNLIFDIARLQVAFQQAEESRHDRNFNSSIRRNRYESVNVFALNLDLTKPLSETHHLYYGLNLGLNKVGSTAYEVNLNTGEKIASATRYPDGSTYDNIAAYLNYEYRPSKRINILAGLRYNYFWLNANFDQQYYPFPFSSARLNPSAPSGSIGIVYDRGDGTILQANFSTAFRAPNIDDIGKVFDSEPGNVVVPNPNLEPEFAYNFDLGITQNFGDKIRLDLTGFYTYLDNAMIRRDFSYNGQDSILYDGEMSKVQSLTNVGSAFLFGFNMKLFVDFNKNWSFTSTLNYTVGEDDNGFPLRHVTPPFGSSHLLYKRNRFKFDLFSDYSGGFDYYQLAPDEQAKPHLYAIDKDGLPYSPNWLTLGLRSSVQFTKSFQLNLGIENVFDRRYRTYSSGIIAPGRNFMIGVRGAF